MPGGFDYSRFDNIDVSDSEDEGANTLGGKGAPAVKADEVLAELPPDLPEDLSLVLAAREGQSNLVEALLAKRVSANVTDPHGATALMKAVEGGVNNRPAIELLLKNRAAVDTASKLGETPMNVAAAKGPAILCEALLESGSPSKDVRGAALVAAAVAGNEATTGLLLGAQAPVCARGAGGRTALHCWAEKGNVSLLQKLLEARADANLRDANGVSPLLSAARSASKEAAQCLCDHGAALNDVATDGCSPLVAAATLTDEACALDVMSVLLAAGAAVEADSAVRGASSPLVAATSTGRKSIVEKLLDARADPEAADGTGRRALPCAAVAGKLDLCQLLLEGRAAVDARSTSGAAAVSSSAAAEGSGVTALSIAASTAKLRLVELLLGAGADPEATDERGLKPLIAAAGKGSVDICKALLAARAAVDAQEAEAGKSALLLAAGAGHAAVCGALLGARADVQLPAVTGACPLHAAAANGHREVCEQLLAAGADASAPGPAGQDAVALAKSADHAALSDLLSARGAGAAGAA